MTQMISQAAGAMAALPRSDDTQANDSELTDAVAARSEIPVSS